MKKVIFLLIIFSLIVLPGCFKKEIKPKVEDPSLVAERFARFWEQKDWGNMYDMFIPQLQTKSDKNTFISVMNFFEKSNQIVIRLDKVSTDSENVVYAYYTVSSSLFDAKAPAMRMEKIEGVWKIDAFAKYFDVKQQDMVYVTELTKVLIRYNDAIKKESEFVGKIDKVAEQRAFGNYYVDAKDVCKKEEYHYPNTIFIKDMASTIVELNTIMVPEIFEEHYLHFNNSMNLNYQAMSLYYTCVCDDSIPINDIIADCSKASDKTKEAKIELELSSEIMKQLGFS